MTYPRKFGILLIAIVSVGTLARGGYAQNSEPRGSSPAKSYYTFKIDNLTGQAVQLRLVENGEAVADVTLPRSLSEINAPAGWVDPNPVSVVHITVPLHDNTPTLEIETTFPSFHKSFLIAGFALHPDLDFSITVTDQDITFAQDYRLPEVLGEEELRLTSAELMALRARARRADPLVTFFLLNKSDHPLRLKAVVDGESLLDVSIPATRPPSTVIQIHDPGCPYAKLVVPLSTVAKVLEINESAFLKRHMSYRLKDLEMRGGGSDFLISVTPKGIDVIRGTFPY